VKFDRNRSFGYPVLRTFLEGDDAGLLDYPNKSFGPDITVKIDAHNAEWLSVDFEDDQRVKALKNLIKEGKACYHFKIECGDTFYSNTFTSEEPVGTFKIEANLVRDLVETSSFIVAVEDLNLASEDFHEDFGGEIFEIPKGSVLAFSRPMEQFINREQFRGTRSIFEFNQNDRIEPGEFLIRTEDAYVTIEVNPSLYQKVKIAEQNLQSQAVILNSLYVPVVMHLLQEISMDPSIPENYRWANIISAKGARLGIDVTDPNSMVLNAQKLLDMPFSKLADSSFRLSR